MVASARVLIVDDDPGTLLTFSGLLQGVGCQVQTADCGEDALSVAEHHPFDIVIADLRLPGISGLEVIRGVRRLQADVRSLIVTGYASVETAVEALRGGVADYLEKPIFADELLTAVDRVLSRGPKAEGLPTPRIDAHAASRLAAAIVRVIGSSSDPRTLASWSRCCAASCGTVRNWCRMAGVSPKRALDFARVLRAVVRRREGDRLEDLFDVVDRRTLAVLLRLGTTNREPIQLPIDTPTFFDTQRWIVNHSILHAVREALCAHQASIASGAMSPQTNR